MKRPKPSNNYNPRVYTVKKVIELLTDGTAEKYVNLQEYVSRLENYCDKLEKQLDRQLAQLQARKLTNVEKVHQMEIDQISEKLKTTHAAHADMMQKNYMLSSANKAQTEIIEHLEAQVKNLTIASRR